MVNPAASSYRLPASLLTFLVFIAIAILCISLADLSITTRTPLQEFLRMAEGIVTPSWLSFPDLLTALGKTLAFGLLAVALAVGMGFLLCLQFHRRSVRVFCAIIRAVHELFWGLLFIQWFGLHPITGLLAIAIPYSGIFAKVFAEILEEAHTTQQAAIPHKTDRISRFWYGKWPSVKKHFASYTLYRLECGLRSSTILGFIGLPTLGFHLESGFMQGDYGMVAGLLLIFYALIASIRLWANFRLIPFYLLIAGFYLWADTYLWTDTPTNGLSLQTLLTDMVPSPIRMQQESLWHWLSHLSSTQILPGIWNTLLITQITFVLAGLLALMSFPFLSKQFVKRPIRLASHSLMVVFRSTPEIILAFTFLLLWGPSMLPAILALAIHNGAIISHLMARHSDELILRHDASTGLSRYTYEILPRIYGQFLAFLCYRWEVIMRETAIVGLLGIHTLGFFIDSAFESFRLDVAILLIGVSALLNVAVDEIARRIRHRLHLSTTPGARTPC